MEAIIKGCLEGIKFGDIQRHKHVTVFPLLGKNGAGPDYLTMKEAIGQNDLSVSEISEGGHVPKLNVINRGDKPVLLLDGEELVGAKQNRVLNTTILLKEKSETIIPVSCTEHGRWSYRSNHLEESGYIMSASLRSAKNASVHKSLKISETFVSDQGGIWDGIAEQARINKVNAPTGAMRDTLEARKQDLDSFLEHFPFVAGQNGILAVVNGKVVGLDTVSRATAFEKLHPKLIQSYVMDALTVKQSGAVANFRKRAITFLEEIANCSENTFDSVGYGRDYRYEGEKIVGSALVHDSSVIHMAFFQVARAEKVGRMSSVSRRRAYRTQS